MLQDIVPLTARFAHFFYQELTCNVRLCFVLEHPITRRDGCLGFIDADGRWKCEDVCLDQGEHEEAKEMLCGVTGHFTSFAVLFTGADGEGLCSDPNRTIMRRHSHAY